MFDPSAHKVFPSRDVIFHEDANEGHEVDSYNTWHIFYDYDKDDADVDVEPEHKQDEETSSMNTSNNEDSLGSGEDTPTNKRIFNGTPIGITILRRST